jgi:hypothetical protein
VALIQEVGLCDRGQDVCGPARGGDEIKGAVARGFEIFVPVGEARSDDDGDVTVADGRGAKEIAVTAVGQAAFAENQANILVRKDFLAFTHVRGANRAQPFFLKNRAEYPATFEIGRYDKDL